MDTAPSVRFGSKCDIAGRSDEVCFNPDNGHLHAVTSWHVRLMPKPEVGFLFNHLVSATEQ
jgi:hypothetical protein